SKSRLAINILDNMRGQILIAEPSAAGWKIAPLPGVPETETTNIGSLGDDGGERSETFLLTRTGFLEPTSLHIVEPGKAPEPLKRSPLLFDASGLVVTQHEAVAEDGVRIPYYQIGPRDPPLDGSTPTLLYGYGGFLVSVLPSYAVGNGKGW